MLTRKAIEDSSRPQADQQAGLFCQLVHAAARAGGNHVAIVDGDLRLTYSDLIEAASAFCGRLTSAGVKPGNRLGVILGNHKEFIITAFGAWKHGVILTPLNPQLRQSELRSFLLDNSIRALVASSQSATMVASLRSIGVPIVHTWLWSRADDQWIHEEDASASIEAPSNSDSLASIDPSWPAVTQYSTGSTGRPKRVTRSHGQLILESRSVAFVLGIATADRVLGAAPLFHSYGLLVGALVTLLSGGTLYVIDTFLPGNVGLLIARERLSGFPGVPFMFQLLVEHAVPLDLSSLRFALSAGASMPPSIANAFQARYGRMIRRLYGSTETGVITISSETVGDEVDSVGFSVPGVSLEIVDDAHRAVPLGQEGLVKITSEFSSLGYDNGACHESYFVDGSFVPGDVGLITPSGELRLRGRRRSFINVNGLKVDPCEVESVLLEIPEVTEVIVFGVLDSTAGEKVKAVLASKTDGLEKAVRAHCLQRLAPFKCPQIIEFRHELPKNRLGKVLRQYLLEEANRAKPP